MNGSQNHYFTRTHEAKTVGPTLFHIFVKHLREFLYVFEGPIISMNVLHRKEERSYIYSCRMGWKLCLLVHVRCPSLNN